MKRLIVLIILACLTLSVWGQPPSIEIITPVSGYYVAPATIDANSLPDRLIFIDTREGQLDSYVTDKKTIDDPIWSSFTNSIVAFTYDEALNSQGFGLISYDPFTAELEYLLQNTELMFPVSWTEDGKVYYIGFENGYALRALNLDNFNVNTMLEYLPEGEFVLPSHLSPSPSSFHSGRIVSADVNPEDSNWLIIQVIGLYQSVDGEDSSTTIAFLYHAETGNIIGLNSIINDSPFRSPSRWNSDGRQLFFRFRDNSLAIVNFDLVTNDVNLETVVSADDLYAIDWLDISDILLMRRGDTYYLGQALNGVLRTQEFFTITSSLDHFVIDMGDWKFTGTPDEAAQLSCIFDETLPTRLEIGAQAQVASTDGTPSRLRSEPSTWGDVVQSLPEGTIFEIIGGYMCGSGYRWWQVQLADGTQGWIAESSETEYWIERRAS